jgi:hypothetical protein
MTLTSRRGAAPLAFLLGGIALVIAVFALVIFSNQAKASADLKDKLNDANSELVAAGLSAQGTIPNVKGDSSTIFNAKKTKTYKKGKVSFSYPSALETKDINENYTEFASDANLFGQSAIPNNGLLLKAKFNVTLQLATLEEYANRAAYAVDHKVILIDGHQAMTITNKHEGLEWDQLIVAESPQGPYHIFTFVPSGNKADQVLEMISSTLKINDEAN